MIGVSKAKQEVAVSQDELSEMAAALKAALSVDDINELGRQTGQSKRLRVVTPSRLLLAIVGAMACSRVESIADLLREFNFQNGTTTAYKAFYNRLARPSFAEFMRQMLCRLIGAFAIRTLEPQADSVLSEFEDIVIQDGSSFALKDALSTVFPGRFTTIEPAAVELHATFSGFEDNVVSVTLAPDSEAERQFLPKPKQLRNKLLLADRGYGSVPLFAKLTKHNASFIIRHTRAYDPWVLVVYTNGKPRVLQKPVRLRHFLSQHSRRCAFDLDVEFPRGRRSYRFRLVVLPGKEKWMTRLCTNLDRNRFHLDLVGKLYRFRWQVELNFKEWKSYSNLHSFDTANEHIAEGLIWAGLCAAFLKRFLAHAAQLASSTPISTLRVARCAKHIIGPLFSAVARAPRRVAHVFANALRFLLDNARRSNPEQDRKSGRLQTGFVLVEGLG